MNPLEWIAATIVIVLSSARITRLLTYDKFPPIWWLRTKYEDLTDGSGWQRIAYCPYCMSFWVTAAVLLSGYYTDWHRAWWLTNAVFGLSYVSAMIMVHDGDDEDDSEGGVSRNDVSEDGVQGGND